MRHPQILSFFSLFVAQAILPAAPRSFHVVAAGGVPANVREALTTGLSNWAPPAPGYTIQLSLASRHTGFGQGYVLDLRSEKQAVLTGDDARGLWYGAQAFLELAKHGKLPRTVLRDRPDFEVRMVHQQGFDKGYGAGDRWSVSDLRDEVPRYIDFVSRARMTGLYLNFEAGWINEADRILGVNLDEILGNIIRRGNERMVDTIVSLEYAGMVDKQESDRYFARIRSFQVSGAEARKLITVLRKPLCPVKDRDYYLRAVRRVLSLHPAGVCVSFDDFPSMNCPDCVPKYGAASVVFNGKALADIAQDVDRLRREISPATRLYFLPRFYGATHWKSHPNALPDLVANSPRSMTVLLVGDPDTPYLASLREKYGAHFAYWLNLTSNHMKDKKTWFPVAELNEPKEQEKLRGKAGSEVLFNFGTPVNPQRLSVLMAGDWLWHRAGFNGEEALRKSATETFGSAAAALITTYGSLIAWPQIQESLGWNVVEHLKDRATLESRMREWDQARGQAERAVAIAKQISAKTAADPDFGRTLELNAERIRRDYEIAILLGRMVEAGKPVGKDVLDARIRELGDFIRRYPVIPNDAKDAEVVARGYRFFQDVAADPAKFLADPGKSKRKKFDDEVR